MQQNQMKMKSVKGKQHSSRSAEAGLTLIECLVAIVVIGVTTASIGPMMVFSVATRVQNQKTEQALQLAQAEIDKVRLVIEQGGDYGDRLNGLKVYKVTTSSVTAVQSPNSFIASTASVTGERQARKIDIDGDGRDDFAIQLFRTPGTELRPQTPGVTASTPVVFNYGVRVYDARASTASLIASTARLGLTSGEGDRGRRPLAALYGQMGQGDRDSSLCQYWRFAGSTPTALQCN